ncbi:hypothetical protein [Kitasatospora sp. NPDC005751]|uniref:hypothetical protein n=1 Tax=Kitasatospora sp. NPDC005751 TaxID=3157064 RepID=UPI00340C8CCA
MKTVRGPFEHHQAGARDGLREWDGGRAQRQGAVGVAVDDQDGDVDLRQVRTEVGEPGRDAVRGRLGGGRNADVPAALTDLVAHPVAAEHVHVVEAGDEGGAVGADGAPDPLEDDVADPARGVIGLQ